MWTQISLTKQTEKTKVWGLQMQKEQQKERQHEIQVNNEKQIIKKNI